MGTSLNVLGKILGAEGSQFEKVQRQLLCNEMGASSVVLKFASCEDDDLCKGALQLAIALMEGGNAPVQASLLQLMNSREEAIMPADGSKGSFLSATCRTQGFKPPQQETLATIPSVPLAGASVRTLACLQSTDVHSNPDCNRKRRIRLGIKEIKERKVFLMQQRERRESFKLVTEGLSARAKAMMLEDVERPFQSKAFVADVLETLRLMCEGHNEAMQDFLRVQKNQVVSHDLVSEIYLFLLALEPELDETNVAQARKAVETLTELVQGNTSRGNANLLLQTKLVSILERLIEKKSLGAAAADVELNELRVASLTLLQALLEGSSSDNCSRMLRVLDLGSLASTTCKVYETATALSDTDESKSLLVDATFALYMLLLQLKNYQETLVSILPGQIRNVSGLKSEDRPRIFLPNPGLGL